MDFSNYARSTSLTEEIDDVLHKVTPD